MKLEISKLKLLWAFLCDGAAGIGSYLLTSLNTALQNLSTTNKASVQAVLNYATKIAATLEAFGWLIPTKWQTAYKSSIAAVKEVIVSIHAPARGATAHIISYYGTGAQGGIFANPHFFFRGNTIISMNKCRGRSKIWGLRLPRTSQGFYVSMGFAEDF